MKKLTDKQKSRLWEQQRSVNFQASCLLEKGNGPSDPEIESLALGPSAPGLPHLCLIHRHLYRREMKRAGEFRTDDIFKGDIPFCHFEYIEKMGNELMAALESEKYLPLLLEHDQWCMEQKIEWVPTVLDGEKRVIEGAFTYAEFVAAMREKVLKRQD